MINVAEYKLGSGIEFLSYADEKEWHALRKDGIGGSDAGAVMGLNKHTSPLKLYRIKKDIYAEPDEDNVYMRKGKDLEGLIFEKYVKPDPELRGYTVLHPEHVFVNTQYPWLRANCDGLAVGPTGHIIIEIKWVSEWAEVNWDGEDCCGIPASYYAQVQHYMLVTGARKAYLYAMFDKNWEVHKYEIPFNPSFAIKLVTETKEFYDKLKAGIEPPITATLDKAFMVEALEDSPKVTVESPELNAKISNYLRIKEDIKTLEKEMDGYYNEAVAMYLDGKRPTKPFRMSVSTCKTSGFDSKRFAVDHPEVYEQYKTSTEYTRTTMKMR